MFPRLFIGLFASAMLVASPGVAQEGKTAHEVGMSIAKKRGYPNPACYAGVFASYAAKNAAGQWRAPTGKASVGYKNEQHSKCGISI